MSDTVDLGGAVEGDSFEVTIPENTIVLEEGLEVRMRANLTHNSKSTNIDTTAEVKYFGLASDETRIVKRAEVTLAAALEATFRVTLAEATRRASNPVKAVEVESVPEEPVNLVQPEPVEAIRPASGDFTDPLF